MFKMKDGYDRESRTLMFVTIAFWVVTLKFLLSGLDLSEFGLGKVSPISITEYAGAFTIILAAWIGREWVKRPTDPIASNLPPGA